LNERMGALAWAIAVGLALAARPAAAAECAANGTCPDYFSCLAGICVEDRLECSPMCPPHLSCQPTTTTTGNDMGEPAPSGFYCGWRTSQCSSSADCQTDFECVLCEPAAPISCNDVCLPARRPCDTHADCPEFSHCFDFAAEELPSHWPPGAGRACKPLLGSPTYAPRALAGGTLVEGSGAGQGLGTGMEAVAGHSAALEGAATREAAGCGCRAPRSAAPSGWLALGLGALIAACRRRFLI
jgi:hypothetical protein